MKRLLGVLALLGAVISSTAQFTLGTELRPRFEYRHGYKNLSPKDAEPATFVSQRTRLNAGYKVDYLDFYLSLQDIRTWGDVPQLNSADKNGIAIHQAWANIRFDNNFSAKLGRQEINYDDARILGNVGWAQQARSHDAFLLKYKQNKFKFDFGLAYNQDGPSMYNTDLTVKTYKALQYVWMHNDWDGFSGSFLLLNNGLQYTDKTDPSKSETRYSQTVGTHLKSKGEQFMVNANLFYQFGKDRANTDLSAYLVGLEGIYKVSAKTSLGLGAELQSGTKAGDSKNNSFSPFYGTNHKFNGFIDYFYVGNHMGTVGLLDIYGKAKFKLSPKSGLLIAAHNFSSAVEMIPNESKQLGTELDLSYTHKLQKDIKIKATYAQMFASEGMKTLKGGANDNTNNAFWLTFIVNPTLFTSKKVEEVHVEEIVVPEEAKDIKEGVIEEKGK